MKEFGAARRIIAPAKKEGGMNFTFWVSSSDGQTSYSVEVSSKKDLLTIRCGCTAGIHDQVCKHKMAIINGDESLLENAEDIKSLRRLEKHLADSNSLSAIRHYESAIRDAEKQKTQIDKTLKALKREFGRRLKDGI